MPPALEYICATVQVQPDPITVVPYRTMGLPQAMKQLQEHLRSYKNDELILHS